MTKAEPRLSAVAQVMAGIRKPERGLPEVKAVERLRLEPGDVVVVKVGGRYLTAAEAQQIKDRVTEAFGDVPVLVLPPGSSLDVVSPPPSTLANVTRWAVPRGYASHDPDADRPLAAVPMLREDDVLAALAAPETGVSPP